MTKAIRGWCRRTAGLGLAAALGFGCAPPSEPSAPRASAPVVEDPALRDVLATVDWEADPCESFYAFACGGMAPSYTGSTEDQMYLRLDDALWSFMKAPASEPPTDPTTTMIRTWVAACRDDDARSAAGTTALTPWLERIDTVVDTPSFMAAAGSLQARGVSALLSVNTFRYFNGWRSTLAYREQAAPQGDEAVARVSRALAILDGSSDTTERAREVLRFEAQLAAAEPEEITDVDPSTWASHPQWGPYLDGLGLALPEVVRITDGGYLDAVPKLAERTAPAVLRDYLRWRLLEELSLDLPLALQFDGPFESGTSTRCALEAERLLDVHLARAFGPQGLGGGERARAMALFEQIRSARLERLDPAWASPELRRGARVVLEHLEPRIGWLDSLWGELPAPDPSDHLANALAMRGFVARRLLSADYDTSHGLGWDEMQFMATAWNDAHDHTINVGLGLLQPPLFDGERPAWLDLAAVGWVLAHELHHSLGPSHLPWHLEGEGFPMELAEPVAEVAQCLDRAYAAKGTVLPYPHHEGGLHLEETMADLAGLRLTLELYRQSLPTPAPRPAGLSPEGLFFVATTRLFCSGSSDPDDPRTVLARRRIDSAMAALPELGAAFACTPEDPMRIDHDCATW